MKHSCAFLKYWWRLLKKYHIFVECPKYASGVNVNTHVTVSNAVVMQERTVNYTPGIVPFHDILAFANILT